MVRIIICIARSCAVSTAYRICFCTKILTTGITLIRISNIIVQIMVIATIFVARANFSCTILNMAVLIIGHPCASATTNSCSFHIFRCKNSKCKTTQQNKNRKQHRDESFHKLNLQKNISCTKNLFCRKVVPPCGTYNYLNHWKHPQV